MLRPAHDRVDLSQMLMPPPGYRFDATVGTTYSLDLTALLGIPVALVLGQAPDEHLQQHGIPLLEAIRKTARRMAIFCQAGRIAVPQEQRPLYSLLEHSLAPVLPEGLNSFHPKLWVIRYTAASGDKTDVRYKVFVQSRNLTFDRSWDVVAVLEGKLAGTVQKNTAPLVAFLEALAPYHPTTIMRRMVQEIAGELARVKFSLDDRRFDRFSFHPFGFGVPPGQEWPCADTSHEVTIISPFLHPQRIEMAKRQLLTRGSMLLISRKEELDKIDPRLLAGIDCWHLHDVVIDGETALEESALPFSRQDIHAKVYLTTKYSESSLWIGSANCSERAFTGNVEFMVRLQGYRRYCNQELLRKDLFGEDAAANPFIAYTPPTTPPEVVEPSDEYAIERAVRAICRSKVKAVAMPEMNGGRLYRVEVTWGSLPTIPAEYLATIHPLNRPGDKKPLAASLTFAGIDLLDLSTLYVVTLARHASPKNVLRAFIFPIETRGIPATRDQAVFRSIIGNQEEFFQYLTFLLGDDLILSLVEQRLAHRFGLQPDQRGSTMPILYEKMLKAASRRPEAIKEIREIIAAIGAEERIVSKEFQALYGEFEAAVTRRRRRG